MNLKRIEVDLDIAQRYITPEVNPTNDEYYYDAAAYHAQQAIEKTLKYVLHDIYGEDDTTRKFKTHNIATLILKAEKYGFKVNDELIDMSDEITDWEANSRYSSSTISTKENIEKAIQLNKELLENIKNLENIKTVDVEEIDNSKLDESDNSSLEDL